jgi:hypothetical protein
MLSSIVPLPWYESIAYGISSMMGKLSWFSLVIFIFSFLHRQLRFINAFIVVPYTLIWAAFVPYDFRNLGPAVPFLAISIAFGTSEFVKIIEENFKEKVKYDLIKTPLFVLSLGTLLLVLSSSKFDSQLLDLSNKGKYEIGDKETIDLLKAYFTFHPDSGLIATTDTMMSIHPLIKERYLPLSCRINYASQNEVSMTSILEQLNDPKIHFVYLSHWCDAEVFDFFAKNRSKYELIFTNREIHFYKIIKSNL